MDRINCSPFYEDLFYGRFNEDERNVTERLDFDDSCPTALGLIPSLIVPKLDNSLEIECERMITTAMNAETLLATCV